MMNRFFLALIFFLGMLMVNGQSTYSPKGGDADHIMDRLEIKSGNLAPFFSVNKPYDRRDVTNFAIQYQEEQGNLSTLDSADIYYIFKDNNDWLDPMKDQSDKNIKRYYKKEYIDSTRTFYKNKLVEDTNKETSKNRLILSKKPFLKHFYKTPANFLELNSPFLKFKVNPLLHLQVGQQQGMDGIMFQNTRGVEIRGNIDDRVWFYTNIVENQARFAQHITASIKANDAIPGAGFYKLYKSTFLDYTDDYDYLNATGYFAARISKHIQVKLGHGRHFIGDGHRSMMLSDNSANYFFLQFNTRVWKLNYQNIFAEMTRQYSNPFTQSMPFPKKYAAIHHLNYNMFKNFNIGIFEAIVFDRGSTFELQYLNPIILYRTIEQSVGSPDNALFGFNAKYNFLRSFSLYGQFVLDEFKFSELFSGNGWWANKFGLQLGLKYIDAFKIDHLDLQLEYNMARPYTYSHRTFDGNYTHFNQSLAHPLGANFREAIGIIRYQPIHPLKLEARVVFANYGTDSLNNGMNWGGNIFLSTDTRAQDFNNSIGQGVNNVLLIGTLKASYQIRHNLYIDVEYWLRKQSSDLGTRTYTRNYFGVGLRLNRAARVLDY